MSQPNQFTDQQIAALDLENIKQTLGRGEAVHIYGRHFRSVEGLPDQVKTALAVKDVPETAEALTAQIDQLNAKREKLQAQEAAKKEAEKTNGEKPKKPQQGQQGQQPAA